MQQKNSLKLDIRIQAIVIYRKMSVSLESFVYSWNTSLANSMFRNMLEPQNCQLKLFLLWVFMWLDGEANMRRFISGEQWKSLAAKKGDPKYVFHLNFHVQFHFLKQKSESQEPLTHPKFFSICPATHFVKFNITTSYF